MPMPPVPSARESFPPDVPAARSPDVHSGPPARRDGCGFPSERERPWGCCLSECLRSPVETVAARSDIRYRLQPSQLGGMKRESLKVLPLSISFAVGSRRGESWERDGTWKTVQESSSRFSAVRDQKRMENGDRLGHVRSGPSRGHLPSCLSTAMCSDVHPPFSAKLISVP